MALWRSVTDKMLRWHEDPFRKALLVLGPRQVGKTHAIREFANTHYEPVLEFNFLETPEAFVAAAWRTWGFALHR